MTFDFEEDRAPSLKKSICLFCTAALPLSGLIDDSVQFFFVFFEISVSSCVMQRWWWGGGVLHEFDTS